MKSICLLKYPLLPFEKMFHLKAQTIQVFTNRNTSCNCVDQSWHIFHCHNEIKLKTFSCCALVFQTSETELSKRCPEVKFLWFPTCSPARCLASEYRNYERPKRLPEPSKLDSLLSTSLPWPTLVTPITLQRHLG